MRIPRELSTEDFQRIYIDKKFRNAVAHAHGCCKKAGDEPYGFKALDYPAEWSVTPEQITEAKEEIKRACVKTLDENKGKLLLVGMGWADAKIPENDVGNPRVRGYFRDTTGRKCFVEANHREKMRDIYRHATPEEIEERKNPKGYLWFDFAHHCDIYENAQHHLLARVTSLNPAPEFSKAQILRYVNSAFGTTFTELVIDNYDLNADDFESVAVA